jgi:hypothetical protein
VTFFDELHYLKDQFKIALEMTNTRAQKAVIEKEFPYAMKYHSAAIGTEIRMYVMYS